MVRDRTITFFPGMPMLTFVVKIRLERYLPFARFYLEENQLQGDRRPVFQLERDIKSYEVYVDEQRIGRFTIVQNGNLIERNFFCILAAGTSLPKGAVEPGSFGVAGSAFDDWMRNLMEHVWVFAISIFPRRTFPRRDRSSLSYNSTEAKVSTESTQDKMTMLSMILSMPPSWGMTVSDKVCDVDGKLFALPSELLNMLSPSNANQAYEIDIGGYCTACHKYLCPEHVVFREYPDGGPIAPQLLSCGICGTKLSAKPDTSRFDFKEIEVRAKDLQAEKHLSEEEKAELQYLLQLLRIRDSIKINIIDKES